jgi:hypothetical protein
MRNELDLSVCMVDNAFYHALLIVLHIITYALSQHRLTVLTLKLSLRSTYKQACKYANTLCATPSIWLPQSLEEEMLREF